MEQESQPNVKEIFSSLSEDSKNLLIAMSIASHKIGMKIDAIEATSGFDEKQLTPALDSLISNQLVQPGKLIEHKFAVDNKGDRFRLPLDVREFVLKDIVGLSAMEADGYLAS
ncbi:hypothetical protein ACFL0F_00150 [Patescibacteria group bacterium]